MGESPPSLENICLDYIACNIIPATSDEDGSIPESTRSSRILQRHFGCKGSVFIHGNLAEALVTQMSLRHTLRDQTLRLFDSQIACLHHVRACPTSVSAAGFRVLRSHRLVTLRLHADDRRKYVVNDILSCLGDWSVANLTSLGLSGGAFVESSGPPVIISLSKLRALRTLDVSRTDFTTHMLEIVVSDLPLIESLDISVTPVSDISPLSRCRSRLRHLAMYNVRVGGEVTLAMLRSMSALRVLDISDDSASHSFLHSVKLDVNRLLAPDSELNNLLSIDISGHEDIDDCVLRQFISSHKDLEFVGLCLTGAVCSTDLTTEFPHIEFTGLTNEALLVRCLSRYHARPLYMRRCLYELFSMTQGCSSPRPDLIKALLPLMRVHRKDIAIQTAVTACLYNLIQGNLAKQTHTHWLSGVVQLTLDAMAASPKQQQLMKNCLLLLCSDHILQEVKFDRYRCSKLVLDSLCQHEDSTMTRMAVAICGILAARITTKQTSSLGGDRRYMKRLLAIIDAKTNARVIDITLKFTLSALWNLSDEAPSTCEAFVEEGGLKSFMQVLETFKTEADNQRSSVEVKLLGFLNNLAEVSTLKCSLMNREILLEIRSLLLSTHTDVSYFAGGILAHVLADDPALWTLEEPSREELLLELEKAVSQWEQPKQEMVAYRSFLPFFPLLVETAAPAVQLWALWAWLHVCTLNRDRYRQLLLSEGGDVYLANLVRSPSTQHRVASLASQVIDIINSTSPLTSVDSSGSGLFSDPL